MAARRVPRAPLAGALLLVLPVAAGALACPADRVDRAVTVERVRDGDTVRLDGGDELRLVGIDTPEIGRDGPRTSRSPRPRATRSRACWPRARSASTCASTPSAATTTDACWRTPTCRTAAASPACCWSAASGRA